MYVTRSFGIKNLLIIQKCNKMRVNEIKYIAKSIFQITNRDHLFLN